MPIRGLESFKKQYNQNVYSKVSANILDETVVCIDGFWFLRKYTQAVNVHEIFLKETKERYLDPVLKLIKMAKDCNFNILWVWDGISYKKPHTEGHRAISEGYKAYAEGDYSTSNRLWRPLIDQVSIVEDVNNLLAGFNIPSMTAPFSASAQLAYFLTENICGYAFGKNDILIFEKVDKVVVDIFFDKPSGFSVELINKKSICERLEIEYSDFKPLAFALGCEFCPTLPEYAHEFILENIVTIIKTEGVESYLRKNTKTMGEYESLFYNAYILTDCQPVMKEEGCVAPFCENKQGNIEQFFGRRLPDALYEQMFLNNLSPEILTTLAFGSFSETDPDCIDLASTIYAILKNKVSFDITFDGGMALEKKVSLCGTPNLIDFLSIISPGLQIDYKNLPVGSQLLLDLNHKYQMLSTSKLLKILSYFDFENSKTEKNLPFDEDLLRFYLKTTRLRTLLKQCKEAYELVSQTEISISFKERLNLFAPAYFKKFKNLKDCHSFINMVDKFLTSNYGTSEIISNEELIKL
ncbi:Flap endonuclease 1 [Nosema granulosis]|uniref:Flap endonuclease 1 n=1 Tax=Nosema granulosis TaxID=83296 RepID=A0A9P6GYR4_9MICR|nr:Flap endonuclease 1 [Nosema granulosis]